MELERGDVAVVGPELSRAALRQRRGSTTHPVQDAADAHAVQLAQRTALVAERDAKIEALTQALEGAALLSQEQAGRTATSTLFLNHC